MKTALSASIETRIAKEFVLLGQRAVLGTDESALPSAYAAVRARSKQLNRSRAALVNSRIDDGFRPFRVF
jgi:hypothetical protein